MSVAAKKPMTVEEFLAWAEGREGRFELDRGEIVAMSPERIAHAAVKGAVYAEFRARLRAAKAPCRAYVDGPVVRVADDTSYQPDVIVECGPPAPRGEMVISNPIIVVEVLSPTTRRYDTSSKLVAYFSMPSIRHYLIVDPDRRRATLHTKQEGGAIATSIHAEGSIAFDPPGVSVELAAFFED